MMLMDHPGTTTPDELGQSLHVLGRRTATAPYQVQPTRIEKATEDRTKVLGALLIETVLVRQSRVGHARDARRRKLREGAQMIAHQLGTGGTVETEIEQIPMQQRHRQRLGILASQHRAHRLDGHRDRHGQVEPDLLEGVIDPDQSRLDVARVLAGLEQQVVGAPGQQTEGLDPVVLDQLLEGHPTGHRDGLGGRAHGAAHEAQLPGLVGLTAGGARQLRRQAVELEGLVAEAVLVEHQRGGPESVGLDDVGPGLEVASVHQAHHVGPGAAEHLVAAFELLAAEVLGTQIGVLHRRARGPVEHENALLERLEQRLAALVQIRGRRDAGRPIGLQLLQSGPAGCLTHR